MLKFTQKVFNIQKCLKSVYSYNCRRHSNSYAEEDEDDGFDEEIEDTLFETKRKEEFINMYSTSENTPVSGFATTDGTKHYSLRSSTVSKCNFRSTFNSNISLSSIGMGTYLGETDEVDDLKMFNAIIETVQSGGANVIDTAINYRSQKSERVLGAALRYLTQQGYKRDELFLCSKNGYLTDDADSGEESQALSQQLIKDKMMSEDDVVMNYHCIHPAFLEAQLTRTLSNIGITTLDLYYLHNVSESQLFVIGYDELLSRLREAFRFCEKQVKEGRIKTYGLATWACFRAKPDQDKLYLGLKDVIDIAMEVGGENHHLRYIQLPLNFGMMQSFLEKWQVCNDGGNTYHDTIFELAEKYKVNIITSVPLSQGLMVQYPLPPDTTGITKRAAGHLQFVRSTPSKALISNLVTFKATLVGHKTNQHVKDNLEVLKHPIPSPEKWFENYSELRAHFELQSYAA